MSQIPPAGEPPVPTQQNNESHESVVPEMTAVPETSVASSPAVSPEMHTENVQTTSDTALESSASEKHQEEVAPPMTAPSEASSTPSEALSASEKTSPQTQNPRTSVPSDGFVSRVFDGCAMLGPIVLVILWAGQAVSQWLGHESRGMFLIADGIRTTLAQTLSASASPLELPQIPLFSEWMASAQTFLSGLVPVLPGHIPSGGDLVTMLALLVLTLLTWGLAQATGDDRRVAFAAGLVMLISAIFLDLPDVAGQAIIASGVFTLSLLCLYRGWIKSCAPVWLLCGFALIVPATLLGGILALIVPLVSSLLFLIWRGTFRRAGGRDGALAFGVMLVLFLAWGSWIAFLEGGRDILATQLNSILLTPLHQAAMLQGSWVALICLALLWIPWVLLPVFMPWARVGSFVAHFYQNRTQNPGHGWIWCCLLTGLVTVVVFDASILVVFLLMPVLAVLTARAVLGLSRNGNKAFMFCVAVLLVLLGAGFGVASLESDLFGIPALSAALMALSLPTLQETLIHVGLLVVCGLLLWKFTRRSSAGGSLLVFTLLMLLLAAPLAWFSPIAEETAAPTVSTSPAESPEKSPSEPEADATTAPAPAEATKTDAVQQPEPVSPSEEIQPAPAPVIPESAPAIETTPKDVPLTPAVPVQPEATPEKPAPEQTSQQPAPEAPATPETAQPDPSQPGV